MNRLGLTLLFVLFLGFLVVGFLGLRGRRAPRLEQALPGYVNLSGAVMTHYCYSCPAGHGTPLKRPGYCGTCSALLVRSIALPARSPAGHYFVCPTIHSDTAVFRKPQSCPTCERDLIQVRGVPSGTVR